MKLKTKIIKSSGGLDIAPQFSVYNMVLQVQHSKHTILLCSLASDLRYRQCGFVWSPHTYRITFPRNIILC